MKIHIKGKTIRFSRKIKGNFAKAILQGIQMDTLTFFYPNKDSIFTKLAINLEQNVVLEKV